MRHFLSSSIASNRREHSSATETKEKVKTIYMMRTYTVFNIDQVNGLDHLRVGHNTTTANPVDKPSCRPTLVAVHFQDRVS